MTFVVGIGGILLIFVVLWDIFETIVLPRRVTGRIRLTALFYLGTWKPWSAIARRMRPGRRREGMLGFYGPLSLILLLVVWVVGLIFGFALIQWAIGSPLVRTLGGKVGFSTDFYMSGTTFLTLGLGDVIPRTPWARVITVAEVGAGFGVLALVISYLPVVYQSFSQREVNVSMLDARAGSPPSAGELLRRYGNPEFEAAAGQTLREWERWSAELLESHLSYPFLAYFRSQHDNQSWLAALTMILDVCTLRMAGIEGTTAVSMNPARLTFAMARHAAVDLSQIFSARPRAPDPDRLPPSELACLRSDLAKTGVRLYEGEAADHKLAKLRSMYEPYVYALSEFLLLPLPPWMPSEDARDAWRTSSWEAEV
jgi:hypothetical protein